MMIELELSKYTVFSTPNSSKWEEYGSVPDLNSNRNSVMSAPKSTSSDEISIILAKNTYKIEG
jgi:hypothetical protein